MKTVANTANRYGDMGEAWAFSLPGYTLGNVNLPPNPKVPVACGRRRAPRTPAASSA